MLIQPSLMFRGAAALTNQTLYAVPAGKTAVITELVAVNSSAIEQTYTVTLDGQAIASAVVIPPHSTHVFDLRQVLGATKLVAGLASSTSIVFHVSGVTYA